MDSVHVQDLRSVTVAHLEAWQAEGRTLFQTAKALGIEGETIARFSGQTQMPAARSGTSSARRRTRRSTGGSGGRARNGGAVTGEQITGWLQEHGPANQSLLATTFGVARQTIAKRLGELVESGAVEKIGSGATSTWKARELAAA